MQLTQISASRFKAYYHCEWQWALKYIMHFPDGDIPSGGMGKIAHETLDSLSTMTQNDASFAKLSNEEQVVIFEEEWAKELAKYEAEKPEMMEKINLKYAPKLRKIKAKCIELMDTHWTPFSTKTISTEEYFELELTDKRFRGADGKNFIINGLKDRVDRLDEDTIEVIDYKSGMRQDFLGDGKKLEPSDLYDNIQCQMYYLAARQMFPTYKNIIITLIYLVDGGAISVPFADEDINGICNKIHDTIMEIRNNESPLRNMGWWCKHICTYGNKTGICNKVWQEKARTDFNFVTAMHSVCNSVNQKPRDPKYSNPHRISL